MVDKVVYFIDFHILVGLVWLDSGVNVLVLVLQKSLRFQLAVPSHIEELLVVALRVLRENIVLGVGKSTVDGRPVGMDFEESVIESL